MEPAPQLLREESIKPTPKVIAQGLGQANDAYLKFNEELKNHQIFLLPWRYYHDGQAWLSKGEYRWTTNRGTNKVKPIFWLSIWEGFFKVSFSFALKTKTELLALPLSPTAKKLVTTAPEFGQKIKSIAIIFNINSAELLDDLFILAEFKKKMELNSKKAILTSLSIIPERPRCR